MLVNIAIDDPRHLGVLSSRGHIAWALRAGGRLGVGNDPRYNKTRCFETFPFPGTPERPEPPLTDKERRIHEQGLISVLSQLHDELDAAVLTAYGWADLIPALVGKPGGTTPLPDKPSEQAAAEEELLTRLIALNAERAAEEARGLVRWLRPEFQNPDGNRADGDGATIETETIDLVQPSASKRPWPKTLPEQFQAVRELLAAQPSLASPEQIARSFTRAPTNKGRRAHRHPCRPWPDPAIRAEWRWERSASD